MTQLFSNPVSFLQIDLEHGARNNFVTLGYRALSSSSSQDANSCSNNFGFFLKVNPMNQTDLIFHKPANINSDEYMDPYNNEAVMTLNDLMA